LPPYIEKISELKSKGVDIVACIASNDSWVMNAWGKVNGVKGDDIVSHRIHHTDQLQTTDFEIALPQRH
jgi:peroxiredoxin